MQNQTRGNSHKQVEIGQCWFSHHHLMDSDGPRVSPICIFCSPEPMTEKHILVECKSLRQSRARYLSCCNSSNSFSRVDILGLSLIVSETFNFLSDIYRDSDFAGYPVSGRISDRIVDILFFYIFFPGEKNTCTTCIPQ